MTSIMVLIFSIYIIVMDSLPGASDWLALIVGTMVIFTNQFLFGPYNSITKPLNNSVNTSMVNDILEENSQLDEQKIPEIENEENDIATSILPEIHSALVKPVSAEKLSDSELLSRKYLLEKRITQMEAGELQRDETILDIQRQEHRKIIKLIRENKQKKILAEQQKTGNVGEPRPNDEPTIGEPETSETGQLVITDTNLESETVQLVSENLTTTANQIGNDKDRDKNEDENVANSDFFGGSVSVHTTEQGLVETAQGEQSLMKKFEKGLQELSYYCDICKKNIKITKSHLTIKWPTDDEIFGAISVGVIHFGNGVHHKGTIRYDRNTYEILAKFDIKPIIKREYVTV